MSHFAMRQAILETSNIKFYSTARKHENHHQMSTKILFLRLIVSDTHSTSDHSTRQNHTPVISCVFTHMRSGNTDLINHKFFDLQCVCRVKEKHMLHHERTTTRKSCFSHTHFVVLITNERDNDYRLQTTLSMNHENLI